MLTTLLGGPLDGAELVLTGFTRPTFSMREARMGQGTPLFEAGPHAVVCNDDGNFVAVWNDGHRIWPEGVPPSRSGGFRHWYKATLGHGYRFDRSDDTPLTAIG